MVRMPAGKMHADEIDTDITLVRRLLLAQFPQWADLPLAPVPSAGTDNALYRLGADLVVRLPRISWAVDAIDIEQRWLPRLAPHLPLPIPVPLARGVPGEGYPHAWSVYPWLAGADAATVPFADLAQAATDLARFLVDLRRIDPTDAPQANRGRPLAIRDAETRVALASLRPMDLIDTDAATAAWEEALQVPAWDGPPVWLHGDLQPLNLLVDAGRLSAIIDWSGLGIGDPAGDLLIAWNLLTAKTREVFRAALGVDDATWARGRGLALSMGVIALPYYVDTNPVLAGIGLRSIQEALADRSRH